jgi:rubrerythrin
MATVFYLSEIVNFAIEREQQSAELYQMLADNTVNAEHKKIFEQLVEEEHHHEEFYANILDQVKKEQSPNVHEGEEYAAYMKALIDEARTLKSVSDLNINDIKAVLDYGIGREKDSVVFYTGLKNFVPETAKAHIDDIIREEAKHIAILCNMQNVVSA